MKGAGEIVMGNVGGSGAAGMGGIAGCGVTAGASGEGSTGG